MSLVTGNIIMECGHGEAMNQVQCVFVVDKVKCRFVLQVRSFQVCAHFLSPVDENDTFNSCVRLGCSRCHVPGGQKPLTLTSHVPQDSRQQSATPALRSPLMAIV